MKRTKLNSQRVASIAYDEETAVLHVWSARGRHTVHSDISPGVYENLLSADPPDFYYGFYIANEEHRRSTSRRTAMRLTAACGLGVLLLLVSASETAKVGTTDVASFIP